LRLDPSPEKKSFDGQSERKERASEQRDHHDPALDNDGNDFGHVY
jgi:hypothetical protein